MGNITPAQYVINPSYMEPGFIMPYTQVSGAFECLADGQPLPRLSEGDLYVYAKRMDLRTKTAAGQSAYNQLPSVSTAASLISTATYLLRVRAEYDHHDTAAAARWGYSIVEAQRLGMRQGMFQLARSALLYGFNPAGGEGLLNAVGATQVSLPPDSYGNQTAASYDNGQMAVFLLSVITSLKVRTNQMGNDNGITICGPQRILAPFEISGIVQVTQYQRDGGGTSTTAEVVKEVYAGAGGGSIRWVYDDSLQGKGAGGADAVIVAMPEVKKPTSSARSRINTNEFINLTPGIDATIVQYCDLAAPREIPTPLPGGAIDVLAEWRISSGWPWRPECITVVSMVPQ